jgi:hypothetical protein
MKKNSVTIILMVAGLMVLAIAGCRKEKPNDAQEVPQIKSVSDSEQVGDSNADAADEIEKAFKEAGIELDDEVQKELDKKRAE